jgi:hypothetical protein
MSGLINKWVLASGVASQQRFYIGHLANQLRF